MFYVIYIAIIKWSLSLSFGVYPVQYPTRVVRISCPYHMPVPDPGSLP